MNGTPAKKRWAFVLLFFMFYTLFLPLFEITGGNFEGVYAEGQPVALDDAFAVAEGGSHSGIVGGVPIDGGNLTFQLVTGPAKGMLVFNANGTFSYTAHRQPTVGFQDTDEFSFQVDDGGVKSNVATVSITITPVNDAPVSNDKTVVIENGNSYEGQLSATDVDGDVLNFQLSTGTSYGQLALNTDGSFSYTFVNETEMNDQFTFYVNDGLADSNIALVTITRKLNFSGGDGSEGNPYLISTAEELNRVRNYLEEDVYFKQIADIDLGVNPWNEGEGWEPIGTDYLTRFEGSYDGDGHQILNLTINGTESGNYGLFGTIGSNAEIKNLQLTDGHVLAPNNEGYSSSAGLLVGSSYGGNINFIKGNGVVSGGNYTGGLIGNAQGGMIFDTSFEGTVAGLYGVGGIAGVTWYSGDFMRNSVDADILGEEAVGGLVGANDLWRFFRNYSTGKVTGDLEVGGLVGMSGGQISAGYSSADVEGGDRVGGLVGLIRYTNGNSPSTVYGSYAVGSVQLSGDNGRIGGLVGEIREEVDTSRQGSVHQSYYDMTTTGQSDEGKGFGGTTEEMFKQSTFEEWDFDELWIINEGKGYPILRIFMVEEKPDDPVEEPAEPGEENEGGDEGEPEDTEEPLEPGEENDDGAEPEDEGAPTESGEETDGVEEEEFVTIPKLGDRGLFWNALLLILGSLVFFATLYQKKRRSKK